MAQRMGELKSFCKAIFDKYLGLPPKEAGESAEETLKRKDEAKPKDDGEADIFSSFGLASLLAQDGCSP